MDVFDPKKRFKQALRVLKWFFVQPKQEATFQWRGVVNAKHAAPRVVIQLAGLRYYQSLTFHELLANSIYQQAISRDEWAHLMRLYHQLFPSTHLRLAGYYRNEQGEIVALVQDTARFAVIEEKLNDLIESPLLEQFSSKDVLKLGEMLGEQRQACLKTLALADAQGLH